MRTAVLLAFLLLLTGLAGCIVPENMTVLREELGYASVELPDVVVKLRAETLEPRVEHAVTLNAVVEGMPTSQVSVSWDLGDGTRAEGTSVEHAWEAPGTYTVRVTAAPPEGEPGSDSVDVTVHDNAPPLPVITVEARGNLVADRPVTLSAADSSDADGDPLTYTWLVNGAEEHTGPRVQTSLEAGLHTARLTVSDGWTEVTTFDTFGVGQAIAHSGELSLLGDDRLDVPLDVEEGASGLSVTLSHSSLLGLDDVRLSLLDADGQAVATSDTTPALTASTGTEELSVGAGDLAPGTYTLRAELARGISSNVSLEGLLSYAP